ncbi:adhesin [Jeotgalibacillus salarius]|uniref:Adhesin n=1 Tax=Jeotgalibacillus salarius TaxID=546023 RepID=A0A4Y8LGT4_9BACL|nr:adhesin [Jeotgalibacillus salarius]TFD99732.1 adhesin [Jeotgalibacillus salarius]
MIITDIAKEAFKELFHQHEAENVRVFFAGQGCGAPQLGIALDQPEENDVIQTVNGIKVAIDPQILFITEDITLDVQDTPEGRGIVMSGMPESDCC